MTEVLGRKRSGRAGRERALRAAGG